MVLFVSAVWRVPERDQSRSEDKNNPNQGNKILLHIPLQSRSSRWIPLQRTRLTVSKVMIPEMLHQIQRSHFGVAKCSRRAKEELFWSGISLEVEQMVTNSSVCPDFAKNHPTEPLKPAVPPLTLWNKIGTDLFEF